MKAKSNMYSFINKTHNFIQGACPHQCQYCYVKSSRVKHLYTGEPRLNEKAFKSLGKGHFYFIGSMIDMFADDIPVDFIYRSTDWMLRFPDNKYLIQTKNPGRILTLGYHNRIGVNTVIGTTIETNRVYRQMGNTPTTETRACEMEHLSELFETMVTIEPIMDFDDDFLFHLITLCNPSWVNIGADSKGHNLPEPEPWKIKKLIGSLRADGIEVRIKDNLRRLL